MSLPRESNGVGCVGTPTFRLRFGLLTHVIAVAIFALGMAPELSVAAPLADEEPEDSLLLKKIRLLGGEVWRNDALPDRPITMMAFRTQSRFSDKYFGLLKAFKNLSRLNLEDIQIASGGLKGLAEVENL